MTIKTTLPILVFIFFVACKPFKMVEISSIDYVNVDKIDNGNVKLNVGVKLNNPNNYAIKIKGAELNANINESVITKISNVSKIKIAGNTHETQRIELNISSSQLTSLIPILMMRGKVKLLIKGYIKGKVGIIGKKIPIDFKEDINMKDLSGIGF